MTINKSGKDMLSCRIHHPSAIHFHRRVGENRDFLSFHANVQVLKTILVYATPFFITRSNSNIINPFMCL